MNRKKRIALIVFGVLLAVAAAWVALLPRDPIFHGKHESYWITNIAYGMSLSDDQNKEQVKQWSDFGAEGLRVLERGLAANRAPKYQNFYGRLDRFLPNALMRLLPTPPPKTIGGTRHIVVDLLCRMGTNAHAAWPAVARALGDEDPWVRSRAVTFFTQPEGDKAFLNQLPAQEKKKLLPLFVRAVNDKGPNSGSLRNNAAISLRYYPEESALVAPALTNVLNDLSPSIRLRVAEALNRVDPGAGSKVGAVKVVAALLQDPDYSLSSQAAYALREFKTDADTAVAALIDALEGTNRAVVGASAVWSLEWAFLDHTNKTIPALKKAGEIQDTAGSYARSAVKALESGRTIVKRPK